MDALPSIVGTAPRTLFETSGVKSLLDQLDRLQAPRDRLAPLLHDDHDRGDQDGDGVSDADEVLAGSDPRDPASVFRAGPPFQLGSTLSWSSVAGRTYTVERSATAQGPYAPLKSGIAATPPRNDFKDPEAATGAHYYRVRVE